MPTNYSFRITLIAAVLIIALYCIMPFGGIFDKNLTFGEKLGLKPGIDMVGGTSLLYEIQEPEGGYHGQHTLAEDVMTALKKRVDPNGVRNLIWRPTGNNRLEIQMPTAKGAEQSKERRESFAKSQAALEASNVRVADVIRAVEKLTGDARRDKLNQLALDSQTRSKLYGALASTFDQIQQAKEKKDAATQADKEI